MKRIVAGIIGTLLISALALSAGAQSGRRIPKRSEPPPPVQSAPPDQTPPTPPPQPARPRTPVHVGESTRGMGGASYLSNVVVEACARQLEKSSAVEVTADDRWMTPGEASNRAKASETTYFLAIVIDATSYNNDPRATVNNRPDVDIFVDFSLFTPRTGKTKTHGRLYIRPYASSGPMPLPTPGAARLDYLLRQAGEDVADHVLRALELAVPRRP